MDYQQRLNDQLWRCVKHGLDLTTDEGMKEVSRRIREDYPREYYNILTDYMVEEQLRQSKRTFAQLIADTLPPGWVVTDKKEDEAPDVRGFLIPADKQLRLWRMRADIEDVVLAWDAYINASIDPMVFGSEVCAKMKKVENQIERLRLHYCGEEEG